MDSKETNTEMLGICERYKRLYAGAVYDVLESMGYPNQALSHKIVPLAPGMKLAGPAFTLKGSTTAERDEAGRHQVDQARRAEAGQQR